MTFVLWELLKSELTYLLTYLLTYSLGVDAVSQYLNFLIVSNHIVIIIIIIIIIVIKQLVTQLMPVKNKFWRIAVELRTGHGSQTWL